MAFRYSIRLSGAGGHGLIQAARILVEAAAVYDNKNASECCSYGPEARGSASRAEIIISDEVIDSPRVDSVDFFIALTQDAYDKYVGDLSPKAIVVIDTHVSASPGAGDQKVYSVPFADIAERQFARPGMINILTLGFFAGINTVIGKDSIRQALLGCIPKMSEEFYLKAYEAGLDTARQYGK